MASYLNTELIKLKGSFQLWQQNPLKCCAAKTSNGLICKVSGSGYLTKQTTSHLQIREKSF